ncbi:MAG: hypothetical protein ACR2QG_00180 [Gammaproteobacteria bacterium]
MKTFVSLLFSALILGLLSGVASAGVFAPAAGQPNSTAVSSTDPSIEAWATGYKDYQQGTNLAAEFIAPEKAVGVPGNSNGNSEGVVFDVVSLGRGGSITMTFSRPIYNGPGYDFAVFENSFNDTFLEFAKVEVSSDGFNFVAFPAFSQVPGPVGAFGSVDVTDVEQLAGKYRGGFGTPFDLEQLVGLSSVDLNDIRYIRLNDVVGDGGEPNDLTPQALADWLGVDLSELPPTLITLINSAPPVIYDVYPTIDSAGFDLDAVGVINANPIPAIVDIDPFSETNDVDPDSTANITVAMISTQIDNGEPIDFDATTIDTSSLRFGVNQALVVTGPYENDLDADGDLDMLYQFQTQDTGIACEDTEAMLTGTTGGNEPLEAIDFITTPSCPDEGCHP